MRALPHSLSDVRGLVTAYLSHTRPVAAGELRQAINYGVQKAARAVLSVRPQSFAAIKADFALLAGTSEYDLGNFDPPLYRPTRLIALGPPSQNQRSVRFKYQALMDVDSQERELSGGGGGDVVTYDVLGGMIERSPLTITASADNSGAVTVTATTGLDIGTLVKIVGAGADTPVAGTTVTIPGTYYGTVVGLSGLALTLIPALTHAATGGRLSPLWRRMLKIAPTLQQGLVGNLLYQYRPPRLVAETDVVEPMISDHIDVVVAYAVAQLKRAVGDADSRDYTEDAQQMRSELLQDIEPLAGGSEALGSDLFGD